MIASQFWPARATLAPISAVGSIAVTPNNAADNITDANSVNHVALALHVDVGGTVKVTCADGSVDTLTVADKSDLNVAVVRVWATGTTATGIHALI